MTIIDQNQYWKAWVAELEEGAHHVKMSRMTKQDLPEGEVLVRVAYSGINYKDAMVMTGRGKIVRRYPMVPGIDLAGVVEASASDRYRPGDPVILTGWGMGERFWGGYAEYACVQAEHLLPLPDGLDMKQAMSIGTAGLTAMLCVLALERQGIAPASEVAVTGATGGVGSFAVMLLAARGHRVTAYTGKPDAADYLQRLGASEVVSREELVAASSKPLNPERWDAAIDTAGGVLLSGLLSMTKYGGSIAACGMAASGQLESTVYPFILRGVNLLGVDSVYAPLSLRTQAWDRLAKDLDHERLGRLVREISFEEIAEHAKQLIDGQNLGRTVARVGE